MNTTIKTAQDVKSLIHNENNIKVVKSLFEAIAYCETLRAVIEPKKQEIVDFYKFQVSPDFIHRMEDRTITKHERMYLADDQDFNIYLAELEKFYYSDACPVKPKRKGNCPLLEAESFVRDVKMQVAEYFAPYFGFGYDRISGSLKLYKQYFDLLMSMFAPVVNV